MSTLFAALGTASRSLDALESAMGVVQNNVANASTPGYVTQTQQLLASSFDPSAGLWGGVEAGDVQSSRDLFSEESVWNANQQVGMSTQQSASLQSLQSVFDVSGSSGIPGALNNLYSAFSAWSNSPDTAADQQQVLSAAGTVAQAFNTAASSINTLASQTKIQAQSTVRQINQLTSQIAAINGQIRSGSADDAGVGAQLYNDLEQLSNLVNISVNKQSDGTVTVLMGGQTPLVIGQTQTALEAGDAPAAAGGNPDAPADLAILTGDGQDVTSDAQQGQLGGLLQFANTTLPSVVGDSQQQGSLNQLAQSIADRVNTLLSSGQTSSGTAGVPLFTYTSGTPTSVAGTLGISSSITASQLAAVSPGPPSVANGIADQLAQLQSPQNSADMINGLSYTDFYSGVAADVGSQEASASSSEQSQSQMLTQAQNLRAQVSGVSLNDQAAQLLQFQQGYEASSQSISTINSTLQYFMTAMQQVQ